MGLCTQVKVAGVVPTADVDAWNVLPRLKRRVCGGALGVAVKVGVIHRRLPSVIEMRSAVPDAIAFANFHVIHLFGQERVERGVPDAVVDILSDEKWAVALTGVFNGVDAGLANSRKIEMRVLIAHPFPPGLYFAAKSFLIFALRSEPEDARGL